MPLQELDPETFAHNLRILRLQKGLTQTDVAEMVGIQQESYNRWERGRMVPVPRNTQKLARALEVSPEDLWK